MEQHRCALRHIHAPSRWLNYALGIIILYHNFSVIRICRLGGKFSYEMTFSLSKGEKEEEKIGYSAPCLPGAGYPHTPLSTGLAVKAEPGSRSVKSL